jgi:hypothetical protein
MEALTRLIAALCVLITCASCGRKLTDDLAFQAPQGWVYSAVPGGGEVWVKNGALHEFIMTQMTKNPLPPRQPGWKDLTICGNHPAVLMFQNNPGQTWEAVTCSSTARPKG